MLFVTLFYFKYLLEWIWVQWIIYFSKQAQLLHKNATTGIYTDLHWSDVLIIPIDMWDPGTGICVWNNVEPCVSKGENTLLLWRVRSGGGRDNTRCRVHMVLVGPGAVTQAHPGSGLGLSECNRWQKPEGRHPMVLIFRGLGSALWLPVRPTVCARWRPCSEVTREHFSQDNQSLVSKQNIWN